MRLWRNWHTRTFEGRVRQLVRVQVPLAAPEKPDTFVLSLGIRLFLFLPELYTFISQIQALLLAIRKKIFIL